MEWGLVGRRANHKNKPGLAAYLLAKSEFDALGFFSLANLADDSAISALTLGNRLAETKLGLSKRHNTALKNLAVEAANDVLISLALIFSGNFNRHIVCIISNKIEFDKSLIWQSQNFVAIFGYEDGVLAMTGIGAVV